MLLVYKNLPYINPSRILNLVAGKMGTVFLDSSLSHNNYGRYSFIGIDPISTLTPQQGGLSHQLEKFEHLKNDKRYLALPPFTGGLLGYISYDYSRNLERSAPNYFNGELIPDYWFGVYNQVFAFDHVEKICYLFVTEIEGHNSNHLLAKLQNIYNIAAQMIEVPPTRPEVHGFSSSFTEECYIAAVKQAISYIQQGDIFEVNLSQKFTAKIEPGYNPANLYNYLQAKNPAPFAAYLNLDSLKILSASPERFLKVADNKVEVRPIKGTIKRSHKVEEDIMLAQSLQSSQKDRAENIMIVDLMRNDLSKICKPSSVLVSQLCVVESFTNLHHLVSVINGELKEKISIFEIIKALFPAGSISGAPKIRAQQIIHELEKEVPRGASYGSIGYISYNGNMDLSVAIRTVTVQGEDINFHVGGAVTLHSDAMSEYQETLLKAQKLFEGLGQ